MADSREEPHRLRSVRAQVSQSFASTCNGPTPLDWRALGGPTLAVRLDDEAHLLTDAAHRDIRTWKLLFFNAWLRDDAAARRQLEEGTTVTGGTSDRVTYRSAANAAAR